MTKRMSYLVKFVSWPIYSGSDFSWFFLSQSLSKSDERRLESLLNKNSHSLHDRASFDCKAVSRSFPYTFHLPTVQSKHDMVSVRDLQKEDKKDTVSKQSQPATSAPPQPTTRVSTHLFRLKLEVGGQNQKSPFSPPSSMG